jgi:OmpA-OmpF porin, OOP family
MTHGVWFPKLAVLGAIALLSVGSVTQSEAQFGRRLKDAVKRTAEDKAIQKATDEENKAIDSALAAKGDSAATKAAAADTTAKAPTAAQAPAAASAPVTANPSAGETAAASPAGSAALKPGEGAWANYDFKPGSQVLFADDFTKDEVGDFPRRLELKDGNMEVVEWQGGRYLRATSFGSFYVPLPAPLPERFTLELDYAGPYGSPLTAFFTSEGSPTYLQVYPTEGGLDGGGISSKSAPSKDLRKKMFPVRLMVDGNYAKVYMDDKRVANAPNAKLGRSNKINIRLPGSEGDPALIGNIRIMAGGKKLYDALAEKGRVATQGIYFDTGSDRIRPESSPTLKEMGTMLKEHPELKLVIEGHTDNVGKPDANQTLSEKRANAVRQFLVGSYGIDGGRLQAKGLGETKPVASNDSPEGRQSNRRVELVKM